MKNIFTIIGLCIYCFEGCQEEPPTPPRSLTPEEKSLVVSSNQFGFNLFQELTKSGNPDNEFISPLSISFAFGMLLNGAANDSLDQIKNVLQFAGLSEQQINENYKTLIRLLTTMDDNVILETANSIWFDRSYFSQAGLKEPFVENCEQYFDAQIQELDFENPESLNTINGWVSKKTHEKIKTILDSIDPEEVMFLVNAVYFKALWTVRFREANTLEDEFQTPKGPKPIKMMNLESEFQVLDQEKFQAIRLPYSNQWFAMTLFLPRPEYTVDDVIGLLSDENWKSWALEWMFQKRYLMLPRFELEKEYLLNDILMALGMPVVFDCNQADFSRIADANLCVSRVLQKSWVKVDEEGTEAAAATVIAMDAGGISEEFRVDRPFVFVIHDTVSNSILFMGKVVDPISN